MQNKSLSPAQTPQLQNIPKEKKSGIKPKDLDQLKKDEKVIISNEYYIKRREKYTKNVANSLDARDQQIIFPFTAEFNATKHKEQKQYLSQKFKRQLFQYYEKKFKEYTKIKEGAISKMSEQIKQRVENFYRQNLPQISLIQQKYSDLEKAQELKDILIRVRKFIIQNILANLANLAYKQPSSIQKDWPKLEQISEEQNLLRKVYDFISEVCQNANSIAFQLLSEGKLTQGQTKAFAAKTILTNIQSVLTDIRKKLDQKMVQPQQANKLLERMTHSIDIYLSKLLRELSSHYPQAPASQTTARMRKNIKVFNRIQDQANDFFYANNIKLLKDKQPGHQNPQNYNGFVMEVINKAIGIAQCQSSPQGMTLYENFTEFCQSLFFFSDPKNTKKKDQHTQKQNDKSALNQMLINIIKTKSQFQQKQIKVLTQDVAKEKTEREKEKTERENRRELLQETFKHNIEDVRKMHKYSMGRKIPSQLKQFTRSDIMQSQFHINNSAVLRTMMKWTEELQYIFNNPQSEIRRFYKFKDMNNRLIDLNKEQKDKLVNRIIKQRQSLQQSLKKMTKKNTAFQSYILSEMESDTSYLKRFTQVRSASAEMNAITIEFTRKYLCLLIYHLVEAGKIKQNEDQWQHSFAYVNLVVFRVGDLFRSKFECDETTFISIINTLNQLDNNKDSLGSFKLVRCKDKLAKRDQNVLINFIFAGKVLCELQLSVQKTEKKDKNYYQMCHFLYEVTRGRFGTLTELATIVCQQDPVISSSEQHYYRPKVYERIKKERGDHEFYQKNRQVYKCGKCLELVLREKNELFNKQDQFCNDCISKQENAVTKLCKPDPIKQFLNDISGKDIDYERIHRYREITDGQFMISASKIQGKCFQLFKAVIIQEESKKFLIIITKENYALWKQKKLDFEQVDYFDIQPKFEQNKQMEQLTFGVKFPPFEIDQLFVELFRNFRMQKSLVKSIYSKTEYIQIGKNEIKLKAFKNILKEYAKEKGQRKMLYKKYKDNLLDLSGIRILKFHQIGLAKVQLELNDSIKGSSVKIDWQQGKKQKLMYKFREGQEKLQILSVAFNDIEQIKTGGSTMLTQLNISHNKLKAIDLSKNTGLVRADLSYNPDLKQFKIPEKSLRELSLEGNGQLKQVKLINGILQQINLIGVKQLMILDLSHNQLSNIELGFPPNLTYVDISNNNLNRISFLGSYNLETLIADNNKLQKIDLIVQKKLKQLRLNKNNLKEIKLWINGDQDLQQFKLGSQQTEEECMIQLWYDVRKTSKQKRITIIKKMQQKYNNSKSSTKYKFLDISGKKNFYKSKL